MRRLQLRDEFRKADSVSFQGFTALLTCLAADHCVTVMQPEIDFSCCFACVIVTQADAAPAWSPIAASR